MNKMILELINNNNFRISKMPCEFCTFEYHFLQGIILKLYAYKVPL